MLRPVLAGVEGRVVKRIFILGFVVTFIAHGAQAADYEAPPLYPPELYELRPSLEIDVGVRYWYSTGKTQMRLYDSSGSIPLSRLTWNDQTGHSGEGYFNIRQNDYFLKGYLGAGVLTGGKLQDEDFPPGIPTYSSTNSNSKNGDLRYLSVDFGYYLLNTPGGKLGGFVGYHYDSEEMNAYGCTQTAGNPDVCVPSIPGSVKGITEKYRWSSVRLGLAGEILLSPNLKLSGDAAWLPYTSLRGSDTHWLRLGTGPTDFTGPTPQTGRGTGMQFEALASYMFENNVTLGVGGRYWHMEAPDAVAHFESSTATGGPQAEKIKMDRYGVFVQLGLKY
jgi:outer membrane protease